MSWIIYVVVGLVLFPQFIWLLRHIHIIMLVGCFLGIAGVVCLSNGEIIGGLICHTITIVLLNLFRKNSRIAQTFMNGCDFSIGA